MTIESTLRDIKFLLCEMGSDGGRISPSVYDTAQLVRFHPPSHGPDNILDWLVSQQQLDGGWGAMTSTSHLRIAPTLAALLALHPDKSRKEYWGTAWDRGFAFIKAQPFPTAPLPSNLATAAEVVIPALVADAIALGINLDNTCYADLAALGRQKLDLIEKYNPRAGTPPTHSWEIWGKSTDCQVHDRSGGVGGSPAATARYAGMLAAEDDRHKRATLAEVDDFLARASAATGVDIPGVIPTVWPINRYEQAFVLHSVQQAGLLKHPMLASSVQAIVEHVQAAVKDDGIGFYDYFTADIDNTAAIVAVFKDLNIEINPKRITSLYKDGYIAAYENELQSSASLTARAAHALSFFDDIDITPLLDKLASLQLANGAWEGDKWNVSWTYVTWQVVFALALQPERYREELEVAAQIIIDSQHFDGGWGLNTLPSSSHDTACAILALNTLRNVVDIEPLIVLRACDWMQRHINQSPSPLDARWLGKQEYSPYRIDRTYNLAASWIALEWSAEIYAN